MRISIKDKEMVLFFEFAEVFLATALGLLQEKITHYQKINDISNEAECLNVIAEIKPLHSKLFDMNTDNNNKIECLLSEKEFDNIANLMQAMIIIVEKGANKPSQMINFLKQSGVITDAEMFFVKKELKELL